MRKDEYKNLLQGIMAMTGDAYNQLVYDVAIDYLHQVLELDQWGQDQLQNAKHFWMWWQEQWARRNNILVCQFGLNEIDKSDFEHYREVITTEFHKIHSLNSLNIYPDRIVMENSFADMIGVMIDQTKRGATT